MEHRIVYAEHGRFAGWPANNGVWVWREMGLSGQDEILVGFTTGAYIVHSDHNIGKPYANCLARSLDGGLTWTVEVPTGYVSSDNSLRALPTSIDFTHPGFAMRVIGDGYHGSEEKRGGFHFSYDRGKKWQGPYAFAGVSDMPEIQSAELTPRTDYLVNGSGECLVFLSARSPELWGADRTFCIRTTDAGLSFTFVSWIVPPADPHRAVMPSTVRCSSDKLVSALRRRDMNAGDGDCWVDAYVSLDAGVSWEFLSLIGVTGRYNGNPPAMVRLTDGCLCCAYGYRNTRQIIARFSDNEGKSWGKNLCCVTITHLWNQTRTLDTQDWYSVPMVTWLPFITGRLRLTRTSISLRLFGTPQMIGGRLHRRYINH